MKVTRAEVVLHCSHPDADVMLDGVPQGRCDDYDGEPRALALKGRQHRLEVKKQGYTAWSGWLEADGTRLVVEVTLMSTGGTAP